ncbi:MAG: ParB N-terminal domain-containing protein [Candidatus Latescibacteria bacterium]|nr:ParB N-terminal domain-containing protein [Candidatus Latescibacterota bacterium]
MNDFESLNFELLTIDKLEFDKENPRLPKTVAPKDSEIIKYLARKTGIEDLMTSIGVNNFFPGEAIVVTPSKDGKYTVLEGNRRLAALRLLQNPGEAGNIRSITRAEEEATYRPTEIPVHVVDSREEALQYLGFRHISGVQRWEPLAKARYLKLLFDQTSGEPEDRYVEVAREIGSRSNAVRRNLDALAAYEAIEECDFFDIEDLEEGSFQFGVFYTAIGDSEIASFIGVRKEGKPTHPIVKPKSLKKKSLEELTEWMFKKDNSGSTRLGESRNIGKLGKVVANPDALEKLRQGVSLESAHSATVDNREEFLGYINIAIDNLKQANWNLPSVTLPDSQAVEVVREAMKALDVAIKYLEIDRKQ